LSKYSTSAQYPYNHFTTHRTSALLWIQKAPITTKKHKNKERGAKTPYNALRLTADDAERKQNAYKTRQRKT
jgi:hypothetical protein